MCPACSSCRRGAAPMTWASSPGSPASVATALLGIKPQLIPGYKGSSEYIAAAVRGDGDAVITNLPILERFEAGQSLRLLASFTTDGTRPDVPNAAALGTPQLADIAVERMVAA